MVDLIKLSTVKARVLLTANMFALCSILGFPAVGQIRLDDGGTISGSYTEALPGGSPNQGTAPYSVDVSQWNLSVQGTPLGTFSCSGTATSSANTCFGLMEEQYSTVGSPNLNLAAFLQDNLNTSTGTYSQVNINLTWIAPNPPLENNIPSGPVTLQLVTKQGYPNCLGANNTPPQPTNYCSLVQWVNANGQTFTYVVPQGATLTATESPGQIVYSLVIPGASGTQSGNGPTISTLWIPITIVVILIIVIVIWWRRKAGSAC
jgi:hypothetical protein